jgi:uncharacterized damage-inducible protein DinB
MPADSTYLNDIRRTFRQYRTLAERALAQVDDDQLRATLAGDDNSIAIILQHVAGNLRSRFTDFLTADGEKESRNRDAEFEPSASDRSALMVSWNEAWAVVLNAVDALTADDLTRTVRIRNQPLAVVEALNRSVTHTAYHVGQIVFLAKHFAGAKWTSLSIPKGRSAEYNQGTTTQQR